MPLWTLNHHRLPHMVPCTIRLGVTSHSSMPPYTGEGPSILIFKCTDTCARTLGSQKIRETTSPKEHSKLSITNSKEMEIHKFPEKELKIVLKIFRELQMNRKMIK